MAVYLSTAGDSLRRTTDLPSSSGDYTAVWTMAFDDFAAYRTLFYLGNDPQTYTSYVRVISTGGSLGGSDDRLDAPSFITANPVTVSVSVPPAPDWVGSGVYVHGTPGTRSFTYAVAQVNSAGIGPQNTPVTITNAPDIFTSDDYVELDWREDPSLMQIVYGRDSTSTYLDAGVMGWYRDNGDDTQKGGQPDISTVDSSTLSTQVQDSTYYVVIATMNSDSLEGALSAEVQVPVTNNQHIVVTWQAVPDALAYRIYLCYKSGTTLVPTQYFETAGLTVTFTNSPAPGTTPTASNVTPTATPTTTLPGDSGGSSVSGFGRFFLEVAVRGSTTNNEAGAVVVPTNTLTQFAYVRSGVTHKLYVNGVQVGATLTMNMAGLDGDPSEAFTNLYLGDDGLDNHAALRVQGFREWTAALTATELLAEAQSSTAVRLANLQLDTPLSIDLYDDSGNTPKSITVEAIGDWGQDVSPYKHIEVRTNDQGWGEGGEVLTSYSHPSGVQSLVLDRYSRNLTYYFRTARKNEPNKADAYSRRSAIMNAIYPLSNNTKVFSLDVDIEADTATT
jgi:hypothetical protein